MKFCQSDGTLLVDETPNLGGSDDPFKTVLAEDPIASEPQFDPMKTMLATPPSVDLPPPSPFGEPETKFSQEAPPFGDLGAPQFNNAPLPSEAAPPSQDRYSGGFGQSSPDPFGQPQPQSGGFADSLRPPAFQEPEPPFGQQANFGQQQFGQPANEWTPPPAPQTGWDNQGLGQNTPFTPPPVNSASGQNMVLPIISLVAGVLSLCCYFSPITGLVALVTGYLGMNNANKNPSQYGGRGLAIAGMITGGIFFLLGVLYWILVILGVALGGLR